MYIYIYYNYTYIYSKKHTPIKIASLSHLPPWHILAQDNLTLGFLAAATYRPLTYAFINPRCVSFFST
jgi:hypothetical protein